MPATSDRIRSAVSAIAAPAVRPAARESADREVRVADRLDLLDAGRLADPVEAAEELVELRRPARPAGARAEICVNPTKSLNRTVTSSWRSAIRVSPCGQAIGDPLRQDVQEEPPRLRPLLLELVHQARHDGRVRILELLQLAVVGLEAAEPPLQDAVRLLEIRPRSGLWIRHR